MLTTIASYASHPFCLCTHVNPDIDGVSALLTLLLWMKEQKFSVQAYIQPPCPGISYLHGVNEIASPQEPVLSTEYTLIALDCATKDRIWPNSMRSQTRIINIDHHIDNNNFGSENFVFPQTSSTAEIIFRALKKEQENIPKKWIENCYAGIIFDTGGFRFSNTRETTFECARNCLEEGVNPSLFAENVFHSWSDHTFQALELALRNKATWCESKIVFSSISYELIQKHQLQSSDFEGVIDILRLHQSVQIAILVREVSPNQWKGSIRSTEQRPILDLAHQLHGGGHLHAAGFIFEGTLQQIIGKVKKYAEVLSK